MQNAGGFMNQTLANLKSNRKWLIPNFAVWGNSGSLEIALVMTEEAAPKRVVFCKTNLGGQDQIVGYDDLVDSLGNQLPCTITNPVVIIIPRGDVHCYLVNRPSNVNFKIACTQSEGLVDLLIMENDLP
jgi:hypothetical protein